jgi:hypothetical protein
MKKRAANVLSVGGQQCDEEGRPLQKKICSPASVVSEDKKATNVSEDKKATNVYNITFSNCTGVQYRT